MKFAKLSLAAIMAMGVSAFADVQNIKVSGDAKLFYSTSDKGSNDLFESAGAMGQAALDLSVSADLAEGVASKMSVVALNTLGLENNLVSQVWESGLGNQWWVSEAWLAKSFGNTTVKVGRQALDTPFAFSETWSIAQNTFDAAVVLNQDIQDTTLVAAWVGRGNGTNALNDATAAEAAGGIGLNFAADGKDPFGTYYKGGAYAFGAITSAIPNTTFQAWYYDVVSTAQAWWLQADVNLKDIVDGVSVGVQYAGITPDKNLFPTKDDSSAVAVKVSGNVEGVALSAAYSTVDSGNALPIANTATHFNQSKLYTEAWWNYGHVGVAGTDSFNITAEYSMEDVADFGLYFTNADHETGNDMTEVTVSASKTYGAVDTALVWITAKDSANYHNTLQVYLTYNF
ncbi:MAG: hypothetical protein DSY46_05015 [Hydrogenimonas sp.]|nr:MAG: hypothetical protein DSY46_05015 [Hydrogenimonas sp.]